MKKQIKLADWLSRGYSAKDTTKEAENSSSAMEKSHILHNNHTNFIYEEENPSLWLINCVQQLQKLSKEARKQTKTKLGNRSSLKLPGTALEQQVLSLGLEVSVVMEENCKFYSKG
jgi:hypothetical protein